MARPLPRRWFLRPSGVSTSSNQVGIAGLGVRPVDGSGQLNWNYSATAPTTFPYSTGTEIVQALDTNNRVAHGAIIPGN